MSEGYVYLLSNSAMPDLLKIGKTTRNVEQRATELWQTGVPQPFVVEEKVFSPDCNELEQWVHQYLSGHRVNAAREFFEVDVAVAIKAVRDAHKSQLNRWLLRYSESYCVANDFVMDCFSDLEEISQNLERNPSEISCALTQITAEEFDRIAIRYDQYINPPPLDNEIRLVGQDE